MSTCVLMDKGPDYERIRAMLSGKQGQPQVTPPEEAEEQSWIGRYLRLAEHLIGGPFKARPRMLEFARKATEEGEPGSAPQDRKEAA